MPPLIAVQEVSRVFAGGATTVNALERISFQIQQGDFVSIVGASGCGKSTLLKIISGLLPASSGKVFVNGAAVEGPGESVGMIFQSPGVLQWRPGFGDGFLAV